jgi:hypothetical protein
MADDAYIPDARQIQMLDWLCGGGSITIPTTYALRLYNGTPLSGGSELSGNGYAAAALVNDSGSFAATVDAEKVSAAAITLPPTGTASGTWTYGWAVLTDSGGSTVLHMLTATDGASSIESGETLTIPAGKLKLRWGANGTLKVWDDTYMNKVWDRLYGGGAFTAASTVQFALFSADPREGGVEASTVGTGYARRNIANNSSLWTTGTLVKATAADVRFPDTGEFTGNLGRMSHVVIFDADTGERMLILERNTGTGTYLAEGDSLTILAGDLSFEMIQER